jgi:hypothetical protein
MSIVQTTSKKIIRINYNLISHLTIRTEVFICTPVEMSEMYLLHSLYRN